MKSILKKVAGIAAGAVLVLGMFSCKNNVADDPVGPVKATVKDAEYVLVPGGTIEGADFPGVPERVDHRYKGVFIKGRKVTLSPFYMSKYEVTQAQYKSVMVGQKVTVGGKEYTLTDSPSVCVYGSKIYKVDADKDHANHPVENVSWYDAVYYCNALSAKENLEPCYTITIKTIMDNHIWDATVEFDNTKNGYRLPTEAEWEYANRGGDTTKPDWNYTFSGADKADGAAYNAESNSGLDTVGWYSYNNISGITGNSDVTESTNEGWGTHEIGKKAANRLGIYDMSGNVEEWCYDLYGSISIGNVTNPVNDSNSSARISRGGSWYLDADNASVFYRSFNNPGSRFNYVGFRVVRNAN